MPARAGLEVALHLVTPAVAAEVQPTPPAVAPRPGTRRVCGSRVWPTRRAQPRLAAAGRPDTAPQDSRGRPCRPAVQAAEQLPSSKG